ncbi:hypothetical protein [Marinitenerispora sediminis]|uniref:Uncharacterized protein n=1 Tax=Marinitenerispora sediminis TaxID=1931232 RepID=A0A368T1U2_9ACTN|nr:hypothetical protein [Marinitenerispora sediminis]RCV54843.1 hypothetical protein DEF24_18730 [Marinitenerispora sediminis]RCV55069.1 hypothetical protein DEF28_06775 [Marinitenerispora sediminis]RCV56243.1 hypothetical protein DEF23_12890 [Marinitenerispora sediminis]
MADDVSAPGPTALQRVHDAARLEFETEARELAAALEAAAPLIEAADRVRSARMDRGAWRSASSMEPGEGLPFKDYLRTDIWSGDAILRQALAEARAAQPRWRSAASRLTRRAPKQPTEAERLTESLQVYGDATHKARSARRVVNDLAARARAYVRRDPGLQPADAPDAAAAGTGASARTTAPTTTAADAPAAAPRLPDMTVSQALTLVQEGARLAALHEELDGLRTRIATARRDARSGSERAGALAEAEHRLDRCRQETAMDRLLGTAAAPRGADAPGEPQGAARDAGGHREAETLVADAIREVRHTIDVARGVLGSTPQAAAAAPLGVTTAVARGVRHGAGRSTVRAAESRLARGTGPAHRGGASVA